MSQKIIIATAALGAIVVGAGAYYLKANNAVSQFASCQTSNVAGNTQIGGPFSLIDHTGTRVSETDVIDGLTLVYFGYTFCPDVCPFDTARNAEAVEILEENGIFVKPVFISIDPERDDPAAMADFVSYIHPRMVGLTGTVEEVDVASKAYKTYYQKEDTDDDEYYLVSHSTSSYLMAPEHGLLQFFPRSTRANEMADTIACYAENM